MKTYLVFGIALSLFTSVPVFASTDVYECTIYVNDSDHSLKFTVDADKETTLNFMGFEAFVDATPACPSMRLTQLASGISSGAEAGNIYEYLSTSLNIETTHVRLGCRAK